MTAPESVPAAGTDAPAPETPEQPKPQTLAEMLTARRAELAQPSDTSLAPDTEEPETPAEPTEEAPAGEETPAAEEAETEETPEEQPEPITVELPGARPEHEPFTIEAPDEETAERLRQLVNGYQRVQETEATLLAAEREREEAQDILDGLRIDPLGTIEDSVDPQARADVVLHLLANEEVFAHAAKALEGLLDDSTRSELRAKLLDARSRMRDQSRRDVQQAREFRRAEREHVRIIEALTPEGLDDNARRLFRQDAQNDIRRQIQESGFVHPRHVPRLLLPRLRYHGMTDDQITAAMQALARGERPAGRSRTAPPTPSVKRVARPKPSIDQLRAAEKAKKAVAAPPGAGAPAPKHVTVPKGMDVKSAIEHRRRELARTPL